MSAAGLHHVALFYDDVDEAAEHVAAVIERDRQVGTAVLVCLPDRLARAVVERTNADEGVTFLKVDDRYSRPVQAMRELWNFTNRAFQSGAPRVHSIGEIGYDGSDADQDWHWYERAVNDVLATTPLTATCLIDVARVPAETIACTHATHAHLVGDVVPAGHCDVDTFVPREVEVPNREPDLVVTRVASPGDARRAVTRLTADRDRELVDRIQLVVSELVTNALLHGGGRSDLSCWLDGSGVVIRVSDDGPGIDDPFASLRPPELPMRGAGLWASHLEASQLHIGRRNPHGTVVTARID